MTTAAVKLSRRGQITIPNAMRDRYGLKDRQKMTVVDIGGGFLVSPRQISADAPADILRDGLLASGATLEGMLLDLCEQREADGTRRSPSGAG